jgi:hypothetical protein
MSTVLDAAKALLVETVDILNREGANYVVVGGWSPFLRNKTPHAHPGTKDVDILFSDASAEGGIEKIVEAFLSAGFMVSAKHDFQVIKEVNVAGRLLAFNVDLLHPSETVHNPELLVDHLNLHIKDSEIGDDKFVRSIVLPSSQILFEKDMWSPINVKCPLTGKNIDVPLITETGCVLSKCESVSAEKRKRDSFDIYLSILNLAPHTVASGIRAYTHLEGVKTLLTSFRAFMDRKAVADAAFLEFDARVSKYIKNMDWSNPPSSLVKEMLEAI